YSAKVVASSVDANLTFNRFLPSDALPADCLRAAGHIDYSSATTKINLALRELPDFSTLPGTSIAPHHHGTIHICDSIEWLERAYDDAKYGRPSQRPILELTLPSSLDPTLAPAGHH